METWNKLVDKLDLALEKIKMESTVTVAGRQVPPVIMAFALILLCIPVWGYLELEGDNKLIGAVVVIVMAWSVSQLGTLGLGDSVGERPDSSPTEQS